MAVLARLSRFVVNCGLCFLVASLVGSGRDTDFYSAHHLVTMLLEERLSLPSVCLTFPGVITFDHFLFTSCK